MGLSVDGSRGGKGESNRAFAPRKRNVSRRASPTEPTSECPVAQVITTTELACCLLDGGNPSAEREAITPNPAYGRRLLEFAAKQGEVGAMIQLGTRLITGRGLPRDFEEAKYWLAQACRRGSSEARAALSRLHGGQRRSRTATGSIVV
jgi:TPR repeat protein